MSVLVGRHGQAARERLCQDACSVCDARAAWAQANPALGHRMPEQAVVSALETDPEDVFRTEVLCQWMR